MEADVFSLLIDTYKHRKVYKCMLQMKWEVRKMMKAVESKQKFIPEWLEPRMERDCQCHLRNLHGSEARKRCFTLPHLGLKIRYPKSP